MYQHESYTSDTIATEELDRIEQFLSHSVDHTEPASVNMFWSESGLLYNIKHQQRWRSDQGQIYLILQDQTPVAVSCVEYPEGSREFAIGGIRTYIDPKYRSDGVAGYALRQQESWARDRACKFMIITFNEYNKIAHLAVEKNPKYRRIAGWSDWWDDCCALPDPITVRYTQQWAVVKPLACQDQKENCRQLVEWANKY